MYYLSVYVKSFKELFLYFLYCFESYLISQKRVQKYKLFSKLPNISRKKLCFYSIFNSYKQLKTYLSLSTPYNIHTHIACVCRRAGAQAHRRANAREYACIRIYVRLQIYMMIASSLYDNCFKCFKRWNTWFHAMKHFVPPLGTLRFIVWHKIASSTPVFPICGLTILVDHFLSYL